MTPKAVCRKVLSAFGHESTFISKVSGLIPNLCRSMKDAYLSSEELLQISKEYKTEFKVIEKLEGIISHEGTHAGGIIIYPNIGSMIPVRTRSDDRNKRIVAFDMDMVEELGFYKFDILSLETLPILKRTLDYIRETTGRRIQLNEINYNDEKVYEMLCEGDVSGVFQLSAQAQKVMEQKPRNFRDLIAINALIRPGVGDWGEYIARRKGKKWSIHPDRMSYMEETQGTMTYQEQFLLDAKVFAGWEVAYSDQHIRKNRDIKNDIELKQKFLKDATSKGHKEEEMLQIWAEIEDAVEGGLNDGSL